jgi:uncharacterized protein (DUF1697 family)
MREREATAMTTYIGLLRGINLAGNKMVAMADLRAVIAKLGFRDVQSLLQSGNVVFRGAAKAPAKIEAQLEAAIEKRFGFNVECHVRTADEWNTVIEGNPFGAAAKKDPSHLLVSCFKAPLDKANVKALQDAIAALSAPEILHADGRHLYIVFPDGVGNSKVNRIIDRKLRALGTARNWNTVTKLAALVAD